MKYRVRICTGHACKNCGSDDLLKDAHRHAIGKKHLNVEGRNCMGRCDDAPNITVTDEEGMPISKHNAVLPKDIQKIIEDLQP